MKFDINPRIGAGGLRLGMTRGEARTCFDEKPETFHRGQDPNETDFFVGVGAFAYYDDAEVVEAIELAAPAQAVLQGRDLLKMTFAEAKAFLTGLDAGLAVEVDALTAYRLGVAVWASLAKDDPDAPIETAIVFRDGYYD